MELQNLQQKSGLTIQESSLRASIVLAFERTRTEAFDITSMITDIQTEFPRIDISDIQEAIRKGSLGKYGATYKLSTQIVCIWIREYLKEKNKNRSII